MNNIIYMFARDDGIYVGRTNNWRRRRKEHGFPAEWIILDVVDKADVSNAELHWAALLQSFGAVLINKTTPGFGAFRHTDSTRAKLSVLQKGLPKSPEHRRKIGLALKGRRIEWKDKISFTVKRHFADQSARENLSKKAKLRFTDPTQRELAAQYGRMAGRTIGFTGRKHTEETKRRISESLKRRSAQ